MRLLQLLFDEGESGDWGYWTNPRSTQVEYDRDAVPRSFVFAGIVLASLPVIVALVPIVMHVLR